MELKPITQAQQAAVLSILTNPQVGKTYMLPEYSREEEAIPLFRRLCALSQDSSRFVRGIFAGEQLVGFLNDVEITGETIELGYVIHPEHRNKGYATSALANAMQTLFTLGYREVITGAFSDNTASLRVMEKAGMTRMTKTDEIEYRGTVHRCIYYSKRK